MMKQLLAATILSLSLAGCNQAPQESAAQQAVVPMTGDSTLLEGENTAIELADSVPHLE